MTVVTVKMVWKIVGDGKLLTKKILLERPAGNPVIVQEVRSVRCFIRREQEFFEVGMYCRIAADAPEPILREKPDIIPIGKACVSAVEGGR